MRETIVVPWDCFFFFHASERTNIDTSLSFLRFVSSFCAPNVLIRRRNMTCICTGTHFSSIFGFPGVLNSNRVGTEREKREIRILNDYKVRKYLCSGPFSTFGNSGSLAFFFFQKQRGFHYFESFGGELNDERNGPCDECNIFFLG